MRVGIRWTAVALLAVALVQTTVVVRSAQHLGAARRHASTGWVLEAVREYQSAIGFHAPFNPFERAAVGELGQLVAATRVRDPDLAARLEDRLHRSVRGTRWLRQPHAEVVADRPAPSEPHPLVALGIVVVVGLLSCLVWRRLLAS